MNGLNIESTVDYVDQNIRYMDSLCQNKNQRIYFDNWISHCKEVIDLFCDVSQIPDGKIVYAGVWEGEIYRKFQDIFSPEERVIGFDITKYSNDTNVIYGDFRKIAHEYQYPCSVFFNGLGHWGRNTSSKQAGLDYAIKNLVPDGLYFDNYHRGNIFKSLHPRLEYQGTIESVFTKKNKIGLMAFKFK